MKILFPEKVEEFVRNHPDSKDALEYDKIKDMKNI
jgi:hypothetical protein